MTEAKKKTGRGRQILLVLSLGLNLLIVGLVAGAVLKDGPRHGRDGRFAEIRSLGLGPVGWALEREDRREILSRLGEHREELQAGRGELLQVTRDLAEAVRQEPFDRAGVEAALAAQRERVSGLQTFGHELLIEQLESMDSEARANFAEALEESLSRRNRHGRDQD